MAGEWMLVLGGVVVGVLIAVAVCSDGKALAEASKALAEARSTIVELTRENNALR